ncbi:MAG: hypothetical protein WD266_04195 [Balneolales bacterium]
MYREKFLSTLQQKTAYEAITPSLLGFQYEITEMHDLWNFAVNLDLTRFSTKAGEEFHRTLNETTDALTNTLSAENRTWGTARTALNLFLKEAHYNRYLSEVYHLYLSEHFFETPVNDTAAAALRSQKSGPTLPEWTGLHMFDKDKSDAYQAFATDLAEEMRVSRVHLGLFLWPGWK